MVYGYDYPELGKGDEYVRICLSEMRKLRKAVRKASHSFRQASLMISKLEKAFKNQPPPDPSYL